MRVTNRGGEAGERRFPPEQGVDGGSVELAAATQLGFHTESAERLPYLAEAIKQLLPALGGLATIGVGEGRVLPATVSRHPEFGAIGEDHVRRFGRY